MVDRGPVFLLQGNLKKKKTWYLKGKEESTYYTVSISKRWPSETFESVNKMITIWFKSTDSYFIINCKIRAQNIFFSSPYLSSSLVWHFWRGEYQEKMAVSIPGLSLTGLMTWSKGPVLTTSLFFPMRIILFPLEGYEDDMDQYT